MALLDILAETSMDEEPLVALNLRVSVAIDCNWRGDRQRQ